MTLQPSPYDLIRAIQDQQRATERLVQMLAGMLDKSSPDPLLSGGPVVVSNVVRLTEEAARPGETIEIDGKAVHTTRRRAKLLRMVMDQPLTLSAMARAGVSPTVAGMKAQIRDTNADLERAGVRRRVRMQALPPQRRGARGGREPALYALLEPKQEIATPVVLTAVQDEAAAGSNPEQGADDSASGDGDAIAAQSAQFVTSTGEGEGDHHSLVDPSPAADDENAGVSVGESAEAMALVDGDLIAVDPVKLDCTGPSGGYRIGGAKMAASLLMLKRGEMFGFDVIAKRCGWQSPEVARSAFVLERPRLSAIGLDLYLDKFNARLREAS